MNRCKVTIIAGVLAFLVNNFCILLLLGTGLIDQWFFVEPLMKHTLNIEPIWLGIVVFYMLGFFQYFVIFGAAILIALRFKKKRPPKLE